MATPLQAVQEIADQTLGFYAFCFADEISISDIEEVAGWASQNQRMLMTVVTESSDAIAIGNTLKAQENDHYLIVYNQDYNNIGGFAGFALDQQYDQTDGVKTLHGKSLTGIETTPVSETLAAELTAAGVNFYASYGSPDNSVAVFTNGFAGGGKYFDFVMGIDYLRNSIETSVFNGQRSRRTTPQTPKGMMMIKTDIIKSMDKGVTNGLIAAGVWNSQGIGEVEMYDYLPNGYYIYHESINNQAQTDREGRKAPPFTVLAKGAGSLHGADILIIPQA